MLSTDSVLCKVAVKLPVTVNDTIVNGRVVSVDSHLRMNGKLIVTVDSTGREIGNPQVHAMFFALIRHNGAFCIVAIMNILLDLPFFNNNLGTSGDFGG